MRSRRELHGSGHRVHAQRWTAFQDGVAIHSKDDAVVGSCIEVNAFGSRREPHTVPANPVVPGRPVSLVDERKIDGRDMFLDDRFGRGVAWVPIAAGEPGVWRQTEGRQPEQRQRDCSEPIPGAAAECAGVPPAPGAQESGHRQSVSCSSGCGHGSHMARRIRRRGRPAARSPPAVRLRPHVQAGARRPAVQILREHGGISSLVQREPAGLAGLQERWERLAASRSRICETPSNATESTTCSSARREPSSEGLPRISPRTGPRTPSTPPRTEVSGPSVEHRVSLDVATGQHRGVSLEPLHKTVPLVAQADPRFYEMLALLGAVFVGGCVT